MTAGLKVKEDASRDDRMHFRKRTRHPVEFALSPAGAASEHPEGWDFPGSSDGVRRSGVCKNLSLGGMQIEATPLAPFGARITIFMVLDGIDGETSLGGIVRWTKPAVMGVQFDLCGVRTTYALLRTLASAHEFA
jgi:PilZ domain